MWEKVLELASRITGPYQLAGFVFATLSFAFRPAIKSKRPRFALLLLAIVATIICVLALGATVYLKSIGIYHIRATVVNPDNQPVGDAEVTATAGERKKTDSGWEFEVSPQTKPSDGKVTVYASLPDSFLAGQSTVVLDKVYYPSTEIHLQKLPFVTIRGEVIDENQKGIAAANVVLPECSQSTKTDQNGLFSLPSCVAQGQRTSLRAEKGNLTASIQVIAGQTAQIVLRKN
jgi:hypothetical protein